MSNGTFIIFGNLERSFPRMVDAIRQNFEFLPLPIIIQAGPNMSLFNGAGRDAFVFQICARERFMKYIEEAEVIITHCGVGAIKEAVRAGKFSAVFVRHGSLNEHVDDHQLEWASVVSERGLGSIVKDGVDLGNFVSRSVFQLDTTAGTKFLEDAALTDSVQRDLLLFCS